MQAAAVQAEGGDDGYQGGQVRQGSMRAVPEQGWGIVSGARLANRFHYGYWILTNSMDLLGCKLGSSVLVRKVLSKGTRTNGGTFSSSWGWQTWKK